MNMRTAAYTICRNEIRNVSRWLEYTEFFDYRVVLDTGSKDGTKEQLDATPNVILDCMTVSENFRFDDLRNRNLRSVPYDVDWCLSPDMDEFFSINVLSEIEKTIKANPDVTNISCARLDIYSKEVFVGQPKHIGTNKIHKRHSYDWKQPIYEHLSYIGIGSEREVYNPNIFLIHDQDTKKPRSTMYPRMMKTEHLLNPMNSWNNWFLANHYYQERDMDNFVEVGLDMIESYIKENKTKEPKYGEMLNTLTGISYAINVDDHIKKIINARLTSLGLT